MSFVMVKYAQYLTGDSATYTYAFTEDRLKVELESIVDGPGPCKVVTDKDLEEECDLSTYLDADLNDGVSSEVVVLYEFDEFGDCFTWTKNQMCDYLGKPNVDAIGDFITVNGVKYKRVDD